MSLASSSQRHQSHAPNTKIRQGSQPTHCRQKRANAKELNLAVDNAALGFCHYDVLQKRFYCNSHFASQLGSTEVDIENLRDPLAFLCV